MQPYYQQPPPFGYSLDGQYAGWFPPQFPPTPPVAPPNFAQSQMPASQVSLDGLGLVHTGYTKSQGRLKMPLVLLVLLVNWAF